MTIHKSSAVTAGLMPDYAQAGVVLCRHATFTTADDSLVSGDTLQMVPVPNGAVILDVAVYYSALPAGTTGCDVGYRGDQNAFMDTVPMTAANIKSMFEGAYGQVAGWLYQFTADDTIDIYFDSAPTKIPTSQILKMSVWYKMSGVINDEG